MYCKMEEELDITAEESERINRWRRSFDWGSYLKRREQFIEYCRLKQSYGGAQKAEEYALKVTNGKSRVLYLDPII